MDHKEELAGGRIGKIHKVEETVIRPANIWTTDVHCFLNFLHEEGADFVPKPYGINEMNQEIVSFMPGKVFNYPLPENLLRDSMLVSAAKLLLKFHHYSERYISRLTHNESWMLPAALPIEVMCHGDFAPYNVTIIDDEATGIIDFDTLHPGCKMWDIAYAVYRWVPFNHSKNLDSHAALKEHIRKTKLFLDAYGVSADDRNTFVRVLIRRLESLIDFIRHEAQKGNADFQLNIEDGHLQIYLDDMEYLKNNEKEITESIS